nr:hypothetical protein [Eubacterium sp.]
MILFVEMIMELFCYIFFFSDILGIRIREQKKIICAGILWGIIVVVGICLAPRLRVVIKVIASGLFCIICFEGKIKRKLYWLLITCEIVEIINCFGILLCFYVDEKFIINIQRCSVNEFVLSSTCFWCMLVMHFV